MMVLSPGMMMKADTRECRPSGFNELRIPSGSHDHLVKSARLFRHGRQDFRIFRFNIVVPFGAQSFIQLVVSGP